MKLEKLTHNQLMRRCAWCHKVMPADKECFGAGAKVWPSARPLLEGHEGTLMPLRLSTGREIIVIIPALVSAARDDGYDIFFQTCSEGCGKAVSGAIRAELPGLN